MSDDQRNDGLHPRHPGRGKCSLIELEGVDEVECGGAMIFLPSGATKVIRWRTPKPITPTLEAAQKYASELADEIIRQHGISHQDIQHVNWTSVCAALQRIIIDFNSKLHQAINTKMAIDLMTPSEKAWRH